jgi:hypothetical protein
MYPMLQNKPNTSSLLLLKTKKYLNKLFSDLSEYSRIFRVNKPGELATPHYITHQFMGAVQSPGVVF